MLIAKIKVLRIYKIDGTKCCMPYRFIAAASQGNPHRCRTLFERLQAKLAVIQTCRNADDSNRGAKHCY